MTAAQPLPDPTTAPEEPAVATPKAPRLEALYFALRNPKLVVGLSIVLLFLLVGLVVPPFLEHTPASGTRLRCCRRRQSTGSGRRSSARTSSPSSSTASARRSSSASSAAGSQPSSA